MNCDKCGSERLLSISGKTSDLCDAQVPHLNLEYDGYAPSIEGLCGGDYVDPTVCLDCHVVQGMVTMTDAEIKRAFGEASGEDEDEDEEEDA